MKSLALLIAASSLAVAADFPRPAELTFPLATGQKINLADHRGKVVALEFLLTTCPGCQRASRVLNDMQAAYGPKGFQVLGVAINPGAQLLVGEYVSRFGLSYPVGVGHDDMARNFLQLPIMNRMMMPQLAFIDRQGRVRSQYGGSDAFFQNEEKNIRAEIEKLLAESAGRPASKKAPAKKK